MTKLDNLDNIFSASTVHIQGKPYALRFTVKAELWLERNSITLATLPNLMLASPIETSLKLVFAGLPADSFREKVDFEQFAKELPNNDSRDILNRVNMILSAYYNHILAVLEKEKGKKHPTAKTEAELKQNLLDVINFLAVHFRWDYQKIGELTRFEMKELCESYAKYQRENRIINTLDNLNNLRVTIPLGLPSKKVVEEASRAAERRAQDLANEIIPEKKMTDEEIDKAVDNLDKQFEGI